MQDRCRPAVFTPLWGCECEGAARFKPSLATTSHILLGIGCTDGHAPVRHTWVKRPCGWRGVVKRAMCDGDRLRLIRNGTAIESTGAPDRSRWHVRRFGIPVVIGMVMCPSLQTAVDISTGMISVTSSHHVVHHLRSVREASLHLRSRWWLGLRCVLPLLLRELGDEVVTGLGTGQPAWPVRDEDIEE
eukprot:scaffold91472_cov31-Tisochrysis_lutea.AAC.1